jgi:hypothetical protein
LDLRVQWILGTQVHVDHLSAASYLQRQLGGQLAIGALINTMQNSLASCSTQAPISPVIAARR